MRSFIRGFFVDPKLEDEARKFVKEGRQTMTEARETVAEAKKVLRKINVRTIVVGAGVVVFLSGLVAGAVLTERTGEENRVA
jgi:hypothetical protein